MTPLTQTKVDYPDGNCFQTCVASLLDMPLDEVPPFKGEDWHQQLADWLKPRGLYPLTFKLQGWSPPDNAYSILGGPSPRGDWWHAVIGLGSKIVHDPHPDRTGLVSIEETTFFVPFNPSGVTDPT